MRTLSSIIFSSLRGVGFPALLCTWGEGPNNGDDEFKEQERSP